jgi:hypothetical protein
MVNWIILSQNSRNLENFNGNPFINLRIYTEIDNFLKLFWDFVNQKNITKFSYIPPKFVKMYFFKEFQNYLYNLKSWKINEILVLHCTNCLHKILHTKFPMFKKPANKEDTKKNRKLAFKTSQQTKLNCRTNVEKPVLTSRIHRNFLESRNREAVCFFKAVILVFE